MSVRPWYRRYPSDFIASTVKMSAEHKGVYSTLIDHMYDRGGPIPDEPRELARLCGCSTRRFNQIKTDLVEKHKKLVIKDGLIFQPRVVRQIAAEEEERSKFAEKGAKGGLKSAENRRKTEDKTPENKSESSKSNGLDTQGLETPSKPLSPHSENPPTPLPGGGDSDWEVFKREWGVSDANHPDTEQIFAALSQPDREAAIAGVAGYIAESQKLKRARCTARKFLAQRRWEGMPAASTRTGPRLFLMPGKPQWAAWKEHYEAAGDSSALSMMQSRAENDRGIKFPSEWPPDKEPSP